MFPVAVAEVVPGDILIAGTVIRTRKSESGKTVYLTVRKDNGDESEIPFDARCNTFAYAQAVTVDRLRKLIDGLPGDTLIVLSRDNEGNGYSQAVASQKAGFTPGRPYLAHCENHRSDMQALVLYPAD